MRLNLKRLVRILLRSIFAAALVLVLAIIVLILWANHNNRLLRRHFDQVANGMTKEQVLTLMGVPDSIGKCGELGSGVVPRGCDREYFYKPLLDIGTLAVFFDSKGRVVGKYDYVSP